MIITLQARHTLTIPRELRRRLQLAPGDPLELTVEDGRLIMTPVAVVPRSLSLSESGRAKEAEAEADIAEGRVSTYADAEELLADLDR